MNLTNYIVYDAATGEIRRTGTCPQGLMKAQCRPGEAVMAGDAKDTEHRVEIGREKPALAALTAAERQQRRPAPRLPVMPDERPVYKILERLERQGYDLGPDWAAMKNKP